MLQLPTLLLLQAFWLTSLVFPVPRCSSTYDLKTGGYVSLIHSSFFPAPMPRP